MASDATVEITPETIDLLSGEFKTFLKRSQQKAVVSRLEEQLLDFSDEVDTLAEMVITASVPELEIDTSEAVTALRRIATEFEDASSGLDYEQIAEQKLLRNTTAEVALSTRKLQDAVNQAWVDLIAASPPGDYSHLARIASRQLSQSQHLRFTRLQDKVARLSRVREPSSDDIAAYIDGNRSLAQLAGKLDTDALAPAISEFVEAVSARGAPLDLFTQEVLDWMVEEGTTSEYRIVHDP